MAGLTYEYDMVYIARLDGKHAADIRPMVRMNVTVVPSRASVASRAAASGGGRYDLAYFDENLVHRFVDSAVKQTLTNLESRLARQDDRCFGQRLAERVVARSGWTWFGRRFQP